MSKKTARLAPCAPHALNDRSASEYFALCDCLWYRRNLYLALVRKAPNNSFYRAWFNAACNLLNILHHTGEDFALNHEQANYLWERVERLPRP